MLVFGIHCHQPVGNFDYVFEEAYEKAYKPFIDFFYKHEDFKFSAHFSGILFEWFLKNKKDFIEKLADMVQRNQLEVIGGGYYEPILASISKEDRILQIEKLNNFCENILGKSPKGIWLTERIWDTSVLQTIIELSMDYIIIDDYHIVSAGYPFEEGFYFTEDEGKKVNLVPIDKRLRYKIPFDDPENVVAFIKSQKTSIIIDDGEKFGIWPYTYKTVYEERWLERFYELLKKENIETKTISEALKTSSKKLVYPASVSYEEMGHWALNYKDAIDYQEAKSKCDKFEKFIKGGIWKNFFTKYPESNYMHKRMLEVSRKSHNKDNILKAQCNDAYWHGIFGGIYFPHLRREIWNNIIKSDFDNATFEIVKEDIDFDGKLEVKLKNKGFIVVASEDGIVKEVSTKEIGNLNVCLSRYKEFYHFINEHQEKEEGKTIHELKKDISKYKDMIAYDEKTRFFSYDDMMWDLIDIKEDKIAFQKAKNKKVIKLQDDKFILEYNLEDATPIDINLGIHSLNVEEYEIDANHIKFEAFEIGEINLNFSKNLKLKVYPIKTVSQSEKDFDVITQGICISFLAGGELFVEISC
ncbi:MAG: 4-alpha-glucanotransferase [Hydrogenobaculum sp.]|nr:MAG: 4-alpha-glucanotransferase [Hydrogenobaculum sp.]